MNGELFKYCFPALLALFWIYDTEGIFPYLIAAALVHEAGHLTAAKLAGERFTGAEISGFGLVLNFSEPRSYRNDIIITAAGPAANMLAAAAASFGAKYGLFGSGAYYFAGFCVITGLFNLIPALPMDGGRILFAALALRLDYGRACRISDAAALACGVILTVLGLYIMAKTRYNISILAAGALIIGGLYAKRA